MRFNVALFFFVGLLQGFGMVWALHPGYARYTHELWKRTLMDDFDRDERPRMVRLARRSTAVQKALLFRRRPNAPAHHAAAPHHEEKKHEDHHATPPHPPPPHHDEKKHEDHHAHPPPPPYVKHAHEDHHAVPSHPPPPYHDDKKKDHPVKAAAKAAAKHIAKAATGIKLKIGNPLKMFSPVNQAMNILADPKGFGNTVKNLFTKPGDTIKNFAKGIGDTFKDAWHKSGHNPIKMVGNMVKDAVVGTWETVKTIGKNIVKGAKWLGGKIHEGFKAVKKGFQKAGEKIKEGFHKVKDAFHKAGEKIKEGFHKVGEKFKKAGCGIGNFFKRLFHKKQSNC